MQRRAFLSGVGASVGALGVTGTVSADTSLSFVKYESTGPGPSDPGSVQVDVIGTASTTDAEVIECVDALSTAFDGAVQAENDSTGPSVGMNGYIVYGWQSDQTFPHSDGCNPPAGEKTAMEYSAEKLEGTFLEDSPTVVNWLWDHDASWSAGRGMGEPWGDDPNHQHPTFTDNTDDEPTEKMAYSCVHEVVHALVYTGHGDAYCDPPSYDTQSYEGCEAAAKLTAPWFRGNRDHTLGGVIDDGSTRYRSPMAHQGDGFYVGECSADQHVPYNWTYHLSDCTIEALGHSWRHLENADGSHGTEDVQGPEAVDESSFDVYHSSNQVYLGWDGVNSNGSAELDYYGVEVRHTHPDDYKGGALVPKDTQTVPAGDTYALFDHLEDGEEYVVHVTPVDTAGNIPDTGRTRTTIQR